MLYYVSASSEKTAGMIVNEFNKNNEEQIVVWVFVPTANRYIRKQFLDPLNFDKVDDSQLLGYYTEEERRALTLQ